MSRRTRVLVFLVSTPLVAFVAIGGLLGATRAPVQQSLPHLRVFDDVVRLILGAYVEPPNVDKVMDGAMKGLSDGLDPDSSYLTPEEVRAVDAKTPLPDGDVGVVISRQFYLRIVGIRDGSPAQKAGLQTGDFIRAINDAATRDMTAFTGNRLLHGAAGSKVTLVIIRGNTADPHPVELVREAPKTDRASGKRLAGGEAYVRVSSFGPGAAEAIRAAVTSTGPAASAGVILDLRDVADGTPDEGIAAARLFVKTGTIAIRAGRPSTAPKPAATTAATEPAAPKNGTAAGGTTATPGPRAQDAPPPIPDTATRTMAGNGDGALTMPVVVLTSNGTAHAAEIFTAALSNNKRATIVGEPTAGLAGAQRLIKLPEGHGLMLTVERYLQNDGTPIHGRGLRPDVAIDIPTVGFDEPMPATDAVLDGGVDVLKKGLPPAKAQTSAAVPPVPVDAGPPTTRPGGQAQPAVPLPSVPQTLPRQ
jgi:carboxyl-terminal processing protease